MGKTTNLTRFRQKRLTSNFKTKGTNEYLYPKNELYSKEEFELLDTIYSDEAPSAIEERAKEFNPESELVDFWPSKRIANKVGFLTKAVWFLGGVMLTSVIWLIYFQVNVNEIRTKSDTQIVFQKSIGLMTDKTVDKEISKQLTNKKSLQNKENPIAKVWNNLLKKKFNKTVAVSVPVVASPIEASNTVRYHTLVNGDSLWTIANKYYSNPSPGNISKIMKANNMKRVGTLRIGQKLIVP